MNLEQHVECGVALQELVELLDISMPEVRPPELRIAMGLAVERARRVLGMSIRGG
jgi:hypothetical protein